MTAPSLPHAALCIPEHVKSIAKHDSELTITVNSLSDSYFTS